MDERDLETHQPADERIQPPASFVEQANIADPAIADAFEKNGPSAWERAAELLDWDQEWETVLDDEDVWFADGTLNASYNCVDRHLDERKNQRALVWEGQRDETRTYTYLELAREVNEVAATLRDIGVEEDDVVTLHMPVVPELPIAMLACARIGAPHSVVYAGYAADALAERMNEAGSEYLLTCDGYYRRGEAVTLKNKTDTACVHVDNTVTTVVVDRLGDAYDCVLGENEYDYEQLRAAHAGEEVEPVERSTDDKLFLIYTSGTTGAPKRVTQTTGGYLSYAAWTSHAVLDVKPEDTYWCTADIGWITGHSYMVYGPLALGTTTVMYEGDMESASKTAVWELIEEHAVDIFYTSPTAIRTFMKRGEELPARSDLSSLRLLGTVGEPINPHTWWWFYEHIGNRECPIVDTWWQTETGGHLISTLPGVDDMKPGAAGPPLPGIGAKVVNTSGEPVEAGNGGYLVLDRPWPGMPRELSEGIRWADTDPKPLNLDEFEWAYPTEDGALVDEDGYVTILGRVDDVINVAGHRFGTMEIESAIVGVEGVAEAAVVSAERGPHERGMYAYVDLEDDYEENDRLRTAIHAAVGESIGRFARPDRIVFTPSLPKTRSGKIVRRLLEDVANDKELGDTSALRNPEVVGEIQSSIRDD